MPERASCRIFGTFYQSEIGIKFYLANPPKFLQCIGNCDIDDVMYKNYTLIKESVHSFHLKRKEYPCMKRNALQLLSMGLALLIGVLFTPVDAYEGDKVLSDFQVFQSVQNPS